MFKSQREGQQPSTSTNTANKYIQWSQLGLHRSEPPDGTTTQRRLARVHVTPPSTRIVLVLVLEPALPAPSSRRIPSLPHQDHVILGGAISILPIHTQGISVVCHPDQLERQRTEGIGE